MDFSSQFHYLIVFRYWVNKINKITASSVLTSKQRLIIRKSSRNIPVFVNVCLGHLPLSTILPNRFFPLRKFFVEQFHRRLRNWNWHSKMAWLAPLLTATSTPGFSLASRRCLRRRLAYTVGSMVDSMPGLIGRRLLGSPAFAIFLWIERGYS